MRVENLVYIEIFFDKKSNCGILIKKKGCINANHQKAFNKSYMT